MPGKNFWSNKVRDNEALSNSGIIVAGNGEDLTEESKKDSFVLIAVSVGDGIYSKKIYLNEKSSIGDSLAKTSIGMLRTMKKHNKISNDTIFTIE